MHVCLCSPDSALWSDLSVSPPDLKATFSGFPIHSGTVTKITRPPCLAVLLPGTVLSWSVWFLIYIFPVPIQPHPLYRVVFSEKDPDWPRLVGAEHFPCLGGPGHTHPPKSMPKVQPTHPSGFHSPAHPGYTNRVTVHPVPASLFPSGLDLTSNEVMAHESDSWQWMTGRKLP